MPHSWRRRRRVSGCVVKMAATLCPHPGIHARGATMISYNTVLHAGVVGWGGYGEPAQGLPRDMNGCRQRQVVHDAYGCLGSIGMSDQGPLLLVRNGRKCTQTQNEQLRPNTISLYSTVIHAFASSPQDHSGDKETAYDIFQGMRDKGGCKPTYNLLNCLPRVSHSRS
jgi:hypothetical protein